MLDVIDAGLDPDLVPYREGWRLQRRIHDEVRRTVRPDTLILLEHEEIFTAGTRTLPDERPQNGAEVIDVDRGGKITWHGPGQLVGYPIVRLAEPVDVVAHVRRIEHRLIEVLRAYGVDSHRVAGRSGVWVDGPAQQEKVAAIGVRVEKGVTMHGFALNCDNSLAGFGQIVPCGISDAGVTTVSAITGRDLSPAQLHDDIADAFIHVLEEVPA